MPAWLRGQLTRDALAALAVTAGYYFCAVIGTVLSVPPFGFAVIWPATPFLIAVMMLLPMKRWWICVVGVVPAHFHLAAIYQSHAPFLVMLTQVLGNLTMASTTVAAVRLMIDKPLLFNSFRSMLAFVLLAGVGVQAVVNCVILGAHMATGWASNFGLSWVQWMVATVFPNITIPPMLVLAVRGGLTGDPPVSRHSGRELAVVAGLTFVLTFAAFGGGLSIASWPALLLAPLPLLLWAAVRLGVGGSSVALLSFALAIILHALWGEGPFAASTSIEILMSLQVFLIALSIPLLLLAALMSERRRAEALLRSSEERIQVAAASTDTGLWQWDEARQELWLTAHCEAMFGLPANATLTLDSFLSAVHPDDRMRVARLLSAARSTPDVRSGPEFRLLRLHGEARWFTLRIHTEFAADGRPVRISGAFEDVTERVRAQLEAEQLGERLLSLQEDERRRISQELQESTAQHLAAAALTLTNLRNSAPHWSALIDDIQRWMHVATLEIRTFAHLLHLPPLDDEGLWVVLHTYVWGFARRTGREATIRVNPLADKLSLAEQRVLLNLVQENLRHVHRQGKAKRLTIDFRCIGGVAHLVLRDDGASEAADRHNIEELRPSAAGLAKRIRRAGGRVEVRSSPEGSTIHVALPLDRDAATERTAIVAR